MKRVLAVLIFGFWVVAGYKYPFQDPSLPLERRINDLISRLSLEEKASLMLYNSPAIERLGIPAYNWWNEALHGVARAGRATVFPQAIALAATFDEKLLYRIGEAISLEARAKYNVAVGKGNRGQYIGLTFWSPNINIFRDPRWGRGQETYGEDPFLTARLAVAFIKGLQGDHPRYLRAAACAKHFAVHSGPEKLRHSFNAEPWQRDLWEVYLPAFRAAVQEGRVAGVMCAYSGLYGRPCCASPFLLLKVLRRSWGFKGYIVSDCWALHDFIKGHKVAGDAAEAAAMALKAGVNLNCGYVYRHLPEAVKKGLVSEALLDEALRTLLRIRFRLGQFDPPERVPFSSIPPSVAGCERHRRLAYRAALESIVLLKNNGALPLNREKIRNLLVVGPTSTDVLALLGNYNGYSGRLTTILEGIISRVDEGTVVEHSQGFLFHDSDPSHFRGFWEAKRAEAVIVCLGINSLYEGEEGDAVLNPEGGDRRDIKLPSNQIAYLKRMRERIGDRPLIAVVTGGSPLDLSEVEELADAVLFVWYPGEAGGEAVADIIFGKVSPSGRLPVTFYRSVEQLPPFTDYSMEGRTYRYFRGRPLHPFGFGLSYTTFEYRKARLSPKKVSPEEKLRLEVEVANTGSFDSDEVVQVYVSKPQAGHFRPIKQLVAFARVHIKKGRSRRVEFEIPVGRFAYWNEREGRYRVEPGSYILEIGASSQDIRIRKKFSVVGK